MFKFINFYRLAVANKTKESSTFQSNDDYNAKNWFVFVFSRHLPENRRRRLDQIFGSKFVSEKQVVS